MKKLNVAIIGCGRISTVYQKTFMDLENKINVVCAIDKVLERAKQFASNYKNCVYGTKVEDIFDKNVDIVHICTPHFLHEEQVIKCLNKGINVLTEKPMAISLAGADRMIDVANKCKKKLSVIFQNRYIDGVIRAKELIESGALGKVLGAWSLLTWWRPPSYYECDWKGTWEHEGGGVLIDQAIHSIDLVQYLVGERVKSIQGTINNRILKNVEVEDVASAAIEFENNAIYSLFATNYYCENAPIQIEISCEKGRVNIKGFDVTITRGDDVEFLNTKSDQNDVLGYWGSHHKIQIEEFYDLVLNDEDVIITGEEARKPLEIVLSIYKSSNDKKKIILR